MAMLSRKVVAGLQEVNQLVCNLGLRVGHMLRSDGTDAWIIWMYDEDGVYEGFLYAHKRSMMRALWREYRRREALL